jgi:hypothetical protein
MKRLVLLLIFFSFMTETIAQEAPSFYVIVRKARTNKTQIIQAPLEDLISSDSFEGKYFKVVKGKSSEAIRFNDEDEELVLKAANVYYHLTIARHFWVDLMNSSRPFELPQIMVRLEITNVFDELGQFAHDNRNPQFNNAVSVPAGETPSWVPQERQRNWKNEIWFRPMKKILTESLPKLGPNPMTTSLQTLEGPFINFNRNRFNQSILEHLFYPTYAPNPLWVDVIRFAGTIAVTKAIIEGSKHMDRLFIDKHYYLDTAMVPEVIYHEFAHVILSDHLELSHSTPVIEGMADYFAAVISDKRRVYSMVKGSSNAAPKDTRSKKTYNHRYEANRFATSDFVLSVLWDVRETLGKEVADDLIYHVRTKLKTGSATINSHLIQAVLDACSEKCQRPKKDRLMLYEKFSQKGF